MKTNHRTWLTYAGRSSTANAKAGGFLISLSHFTVTEYASKFGREVDEALHGIPLYTGKITSIEAISGSTIKLVLFVPVGYPASGTVANIGEIAIYNSDNVMFAHGYFDPLLEKASEYGFTIAVYLTCSDLGNVINVIESTHNSIPASPRVDVMPSAEASAQNALAVLDQSVNPDGSGRAGIAIKYGPGGRLWSFTDHHRVFVGNVTTGADDKQFVLEPSSNGFWLNDQEYVIVSCISGPGYGENRKAQFLYPNMFVMDEGLQIADTSLVAVWRDSANQLPTRSTDIPSYSVLGVGSNSYSKSVQQMPIGAFTLVNAEGTLPANQRSIQVPGLSEFTKATKEHFVVFLDGEFVHPAQWILAANGTVSVQPVNEPRRYSVEVLNFNGDLSASSLCYQTEYVAEEGQTMYQLPVIPNDVTQVIVWHADKKLERSKYTHTDTHVDLQDVVVRKGDVIKLAMFVNYMQANTRSVVHTADLKIQAGVYAYDLGDLPTRRHTAIVMVGERFISEDNYTINPNGFLYIEPKQLAGVPEDTPLYVIGLGYEDGYVAPGTIAQTGSDTGPKWIDPAGVESNPCRVNIKRLTFYSDGVDTVFPVGSLRDKDYAIVFVGNEFLPTDYYDYLPVTGSVMLKTAVASGRTVDIYCVETPEDPNGIGDRINFVETQFLTGNDGGRYLLPDGATLDNTFVYVDGKFEHLNNLSLAGTVLSLRREPMSGLKLYTITLLKDSMEGYATRIIRERLTQTDEHKYPLSYDYTRDGLQLFSGFVFQDNATYTLETPTDLLVKTPMKGLPLDTLWIKNGLPKTRLIKRDEYEAFRMWLTSEMRKYIPWDTDKIQWNNLSRKVHNMLACPLQKLSQVMSGNMDSVLNGRGSASDKELAEGLGLQPIKKSVALDLITTAAYSAIGAGAMFGVPNKFNVFQYLELSLRDQLGSDSFSIKKYEIGKKYLIDSIDVSGLEFTARSRSEIPQVHNSTSVFVRMSGNPGSATYSGMPLMVMIWDMIYSNSSAVLPGGFTGSNEKIRVTASMVEDTVTNLRTFQMAIADDYSNKTYNVKVQRPMRVLPENYNVDQLAYLENPDNAPGYILLAARIYANYRYNNIDITQAMWSIKNTSYDGTRLDRAWSPGGVLRAVVIDNPNYLKTVGYTAGLTFSASVDHYSKDTGDAELTIAMSGTVGYTYFPADQMMTKMTLPVAYTIYPGLIVNPDGTTEVILSPDDLFKSCCWENFTPATVLDCATGDPAGSVPPVDGAVLPYVDLAYIDPEYLADNKAAAASNN